MGRRGEQSWDERVWSRYAEEREWVDGSVNLRREGEDCPRGTRGPNVYDFETPEVRKRAPQKALGVYLLAMLARPGGALLLSANADAAPPVALRAHRAAGWLCMLCDCLWPLRTTMFLWIHDMSCSLPPQYHMLSIAREAIENVIESQMDLEEHIVDVIKRNCVMVRPCAVSYAKSWAATKLSLAPNVRLPRRSAQMERLMRSVSR